MKKCIVYVCHNLATVEKVFHNLIDDVYIIFVGKEHTYAHPKIIVARDYINIESEHKLLTFTAWYVIAKNKLLDDYDSYCILEYDCIISDIVTFKNELNKYTGDVVSFFVDSTNFLLDINTTCFYKFLHSKNIETTYSPNTLWGSTTNHCIKKNVLYKFVDWYFPHCLWFKISDNFNYSYYHERLFSVFLMHYSISQQCMLNYANHEGSNSHAITRQLPVNDFDVDFYLDTYPDIREYSKMNKSVATQHFINHGYTEKRMYKPASSNYFLLYDDETGKYNLQPLINSIKKYTSFTIIIFKKSNIDKSFLEKHHDIFSQSRGGGYWLWKPYIICETLKTLDPGSVLFYIDSSYTFSAPFDLGHVEKNDIQIWKNKPNEDVYKMKQYCKMDVIDPNTYDMEMCWAGAIVLKNTLYSTKLIEEWLQLCNLQTITDTPSIVQNSPEFVEHRHDQSLLSVVLHRFNVELSFMPNTFLKNVRYDVNADFTVDL
jgi:hypothetical protein